jgi:hypothetical protein
VEQAFGQHLKVEVGIESLVRLFCCSLWHGKTSMIGGVVFRCFPIGGIGVSTSFEDVVFLKSPPWLSCLTLGVFEVLGEFVWRSYWRGLVGLVLSAEGGSFVPEMEEMFVRRLVVVLWEKNLFFLINSV